MTDTASPRATYRLQLRGSVDLRRAAALVPYIERLGASHLYLSPVFRARTGSSHGYDVVDPGALDPVLGSEEDLAALAHALHRRGMGLVLDVVPNHVAIGPENPWWWDLLLHGRGSRYADFFDVDWEAARPALRGKVLVPILGESYGKALEAGALRVVVERGRPELAYHEHRLPIRSEAVDAGALGTLRGAALHRLLEAQSWRLAHWRTARDELNYRRFFDVSELAGLRVEREEVFEAVHRRLLDWVAAGLVDGLRIDHVDGLLDPEGYLRRLREACAPRVPYLVVEKILSAGESLPAGWPVDGTTGYEFLNLVLGLLVDPAGADPLERAYRRFVRGAPPFGEVLYASKLHVLRFLLRAELRGLARGFARLAERDWHTRDLSEDSLAQALADVIASLRVYRTYVGAGGASAWDRRELERAVREARRRNPRLHPGAVDWIEQVWSGVVACPKLRPDAMALALRLQQLTGPVQAKGLEDTSFYRYHRLVALNEVGGDPRRFAVAPGTFHAANLERARRLPRAMLSTASHDTKRGEDVRARLAVLSEVPDAWQAQVLAFARANRALKQRVKGRLAPGASDEYLLYQTLVGSWPTPAPKRADLARYRERIEAYVHKAVREGKEGSSWRAPDPAYEQALVAFAGGLLDPERSADFLAALERFVAGLAGAGAANALAQLTLKLTAPGVPDLYQGTELWDRSLVDPDNRRPVDFERLGRLLDGLDPEPAAAPDPALEALAAAWPDGRLKLLLTARLLGLRRADPALFAAGAYVPLEARGVRATHVCGFLRRGEQRALLVAVARLTAGLATTPGQLPTGAPAFAGTHVTLPAEDARRRWRDVLSGHVHEAGSAGGPAALRAEALFASLPVAVLVDGPALEVSRQRPA